MGKTTTEEIMVQYARSRLLTLYRELLRGRGADWTVTNREVDRAAAVIEELSINDLYELAQKIPQESGGRKV